MAILSVKNIKKTYTTRFGGNQVQALKNVTFDVEQGEYEKAQQALDKGFSYGSTDASQMLKKNQVLLYERQKKRTEAKKAAKEYMKLYPNDTGMQKELRFITLK